MKETDTPHKMTREEQREDDKNIYIEVCQLRSELYTPLNEVMKVILAKIQAAHPNRRIKDVAQLYAITKRVEERIKIEAKRIKLS